MIYTSYFENLRHIDLDKYSVFSICNSKPQFIKDSRVVDFGFLLGPQQPLLADYKSGLVNEEQYTEIYTAWLNSNKEDILEFLILPFTLPKGPSCILLCYEKPPKFCHRSILADWVKTNFEIVITEL